MGVFSLFKGRTVGASTKIEALQKGPIKQRVEVIKLELDNNEPGVGLKVIAHSLLSYQSIPVSLNKKQAKELSDQILLALGTKV